MTSREDGKTSQETTGDARSELQNLNLGNGGCGLIAEVLSTCTTCLSLPDTGKILECMIDAFY